MVLTRLHRTLVAGCADPSCARKSSRSTTRNICSTLITYIWLAVKSIRGIKQHTYLSRCSAGFRFALVPRHCASAHIKTLTGRLSKTHRLRFATALCTVIVRYRYHAGSAVMHTYSPLGLRKEVLADRENIRTHLEDTHVYQSSSVRPATRKVAPFPIIYRTYCTIPRVRFTGSSSKGTVTPKRVYECYLFEASLSVQVPRPNEAYCVWTEVPYEVCKQGVREYQVEQLQ